jgi:hypothetical protein
MLIAASPSSSATAIAAASTEERVKGGRREFFLRNPISPCTDLTLYGELPTLHLHRKVPESPWPFPPSSVATPDTRVCFI